MTIEILHLDGVWRPSTIRDLSAYPGDTDADKIAYLNRVCFKQRGQDIWRLAPTSDSTNKPHS